MARSGVWNGRIGMGGVEKLREGGERAGGIGGGKRKWRVAGRLRAHVERALPGGRCWGGTKSEPQSS